MHADASDLLAWLGALRPRPRRVFCVHGEPDSALALARRITEELGIEATVPGHLDSVRVG
ncbi:MBL fold metallo-hydrolase RNA specificity domain-containing protein [Actinomyces polynesiensis]|uniref:MBL fold metallo-hydrolase RNA specificity domain-containing protein n=1 Tax=Actinomyces polynesiensis TaxID=1325934 RepID=UPI001E44DF7A|nr:MBL fold metallo-hydrolase RNA specificity domain-containing protein [Actinomyces polynesiensis]